jgi:hypothetical protein
LNWPSQQALNEDLNYITAAYAGYGETLETIFGTKEDTAPEVARDAKGNEIVMTPDLFDTMFGGDERPFEVRRKKMN